MTAYFDRAGVALREAVTGMQQTGATQPILDIEERVVRDVTVCVMMPGFPEDLARRVHLKILDRAIEARPVNRENHPHAGAFESIYDAVEEINALIFDLHTIFHELAERRLEGFSDDPLCPFRVLYAKGEAVRESMDWPGATRNPESGAES